MGTQPMILRICHSIIQIASRMVPAKRRENWRTEWEAELTHAWTTLDRRGAADLGARMRILRRATCALRDACAVRRLARPSPVRVPSPRSRNRASLTNDVLHDIRMAFRSLQRTPGVTAIALLTISLGIGSTTAIFSVVNGVLLKPLPHEDADKLVIVWETDQRNTPPTTRVMVSPGNLSDWREQARGFEGFAVYSLGRVPLTGLGEPEMVMRAWVSSNFLPLLHSRPTLGRIFTEGEDVPGNDLVVVLSHQFWQTRFGGSPEVLGRTLTLNGNGYEIVGVLDPGVDFLARGIQVWTPYLLAPSESENRSEYYLNVLARMRPEVSLRQAQAEMNAIADRTRLEYPDWMTNRGFNVVPLRDQMVGSAKLTLLVLFGAGLVVLLIAAVNVANLALVRSVERRREFAVRRALGAGQSRLVRQCLLESTTLSLVGGAFGILLATVVTDAILALAPGNVQQVADVALDTRVLVFALGVSVLTGIVFGLVPAFRSSRPDTDGALMDDSRWSSGSDRSRFRQTLVVGEVALSMILLIGAGLLTQTFWRLTAVDPGFSTERILAANFRMPRSDYPDVGRANAFYDELLVEVNALPQVTSAGLTRFVPLSDGPWTFALKVEGQQPVPLAQRRGYGLHPISTDYFRTAGIALRRGRNFTDADNADAVPVVIINESMKQQFWPTEDPIGSRILFDQDSAQGIWREIVGVVSDVRHDGPLQTARPTVYAPQHQAHLFLVDRMRLVVRTSSLPQAIANDVRRIVNRLDPNLPVYDMRRMDELAASAVAQPRFAMLLVLCFAGAAAVLALIGVYGVISYSVRQRWPELGLRIALGARSESVGRMMLVRGLLLTTLGIAFGAAAALAFSRVIGSMLFEISPTDPLTYIALALLLAAAAAAACYVPARRAAAADPMVVMRGGE